jgi:hypothetical protein
MLQPGDEVIQRNVQTIRGDIWRRGIVKGGDYPLYSVKWFEEEGRSITGWGMYNISLLEKVEKIDFAGLVLERQLLLTAIDSALDNQDEQLFLELTEKLKDINNLSTK